MSPASGGRMQFTGRWSSAVAQFAEFMIQPKTPDRRQLLEHGHGKFMQQR